MPVYRLEPFAPGDSGWLASVMDPERCWVLADSADDARAKVTAYAYGVRKPEGNDPPSEALYWTRFAACDLDETVTVPSGIILTSRGQKIPIPRAA
jgi:hypothetical protein